MKNESKGNNENSPVQDVALKTPWAIWECYRTKQSVPPGEYGADLNSIVKFSTMSEFAQVWNNFPHKYITDLFFFDDDLTELKEYEISSKRWEVIDGLCLFRENIKPMWEDPQNKNGSEYRISLSGLSKLNINQCWENLVFALISEAMECTSHILGIRFLNKILSKEKIIRIEVWVDFKDSSHDLKEKLQNEIGAFLREECFIDSYIKTLEWKNH